MGIACPNESLPEWQELVASVKNPYTLWNRYKGEVPLKYYGQSQEDVDRDKATAWVTNTFGKDKIHYYDYIKQIGNRTVMGYVANGAMNISKSSEVGTEFHEGYHLMFRTMLSDAQRSLLYSDATREYGKPTAEEVEARKKQFPTISDQEAYELVLEEKMAEGFRMHMLTEGESSKTLGQKIKSWFADLFDFIKAILTDRVTLKQTYSLLKNSKVNSSLLGRKILRNPETMKSSINPEMHVDGMPTEVVEEIVEGLTDMVIEDLNRWKDPDMGLILGNNKTSGSVVHGLLQHLYKYKDGRQINPAKDLKPLRQAFDLEKEYNKYRIGFENTKKEEYKEKMDTAAKALKEHRAKFGIAMNNYPAILDTMSDRDTKIAKEQRQIRDYIYKVVDNWRGKFEAGTGNVIARSWRDEIERNLRNYGYVVKKGKVTIVDVEQGDDEIQELDQKEMQEHIHNLKSVERPLKDKLSKEVKILIRRIPITETIEVGGKLKTVEVKNKIFNNRPKYHDADFVYKQLLELWSDVKSFEEMMVKLENFALHRDDYKSIARSIRRMSNKEKAMLFKNFATTINRYHIVIVGNSSKIFDSNLATTEQKTAMEWRNNAIEVAGQATENEDSRALYIKNVEFDEEDNDASSFSIKANKLAEIKQSFKKISEARKSRTSQDKDFNSENGEPSEAVIALANFFWNLGINFGSKYDINETIDNLQKLIDTGMYVTQKKTGTKKLSGKGLYNYIVENAMLLDIVKTMVQTTNDSKGLPVYGKDVASVEPYFTKFKSGVKFLSTLSPMFVSRTAQSFVNMERKAIFPVQHRTPVDDVIINLLDDVNKNGEDALKLQKTDKFHIYDPTGNKEGYSMIYKHMISNPNYVFQLMDKATVSSDGIKGKNDIDGEAYGNFNAIDHILTRLYHFVNNGKEDFFYCAVPTQADREDLLFMLMPRLRGHGSDSLNYKKNSFVFKQMILQDLLRISEAQKTIDSQTATKSLGYHTDAMLGIDGTGRYMQLDAIDSRTGQRIVQDYIIKPDGVQLKMSDLVEDYINLKPSQELSTELQQFENKLAEMLTALNIFYNDAAEEIAMKIIEAGRYEDIDKKVAKQWKATKSKDDEKALEKLTNEEAAKMRKVLVIKDLIKDFIVHEDVGTAEIIKITRGNRAAFASNEAFTKRQRLLGTPGTLLAIRGKMGLKEAEGIEPYGMIPNFNDFTFIDPKGDITASILQANKDYVQRTMDKLKTVVNPNSPTGDFFTDEEISFMLGYNPGEFDEPDGLALISMDMYRYIAEGKGEWGIEEIEAYKAYKRNGSIGGLFYQPGFVPRGLKAGDPVVIKPLKPYFEDLRSVGGVILPEMHKNSYFPLMESYTKDFPILNDLRERMELTGAYAGRTDLKPVHVANALSAKKGLKTNVHSFVSNLDETGEFRFGSLDNITLVEQDSSKLRFPQEIPDPKGTKDVIFNRQAKKNAIANVKQDGIYYFNPGLQDSIGISGQKLMDLYHAGIQERIRRDLESVDKEIGLDKFRKVVQNLAEGVKGKNKVSKIVSSEEFANAKLELLKNIRGILESQAIEREMSQNYLDALDITIDPITNIPRFSISLDYPVFGKRFQSALLSIYNNNVFKQRLSGMEAVQTGVLGGFETNEQLGFLEVEDDTNNVYGARLVHAEIMVRADVLRKYNIAEGETSLDSIPEELRRIIGYRIPNQDKASMVILKIVKVLPENYAKAIVIPPQLVKLMGSDYDIDKMFLLFPEVGYDENGNMFKYKPNYLALKTDIAGVTKLKDEELNNLFLDTIEAVLSSPIHFTETLSPLDTKALGDIKDTIIQKMPDLEDVSMFTGGMYHTTSAIRNLLGNKLRGRWSNVLAGRNVAQHLNINLFDSFAVKVEGEVINTKFLTKIDNPFAIYDHLQFTDKIISRYLNAAVDASKNPFHYIINDNEVTFPVETLWINFYGDTNLLHHFLNQPIIRDFVNVMSDKHNNNLGRVNDAYKQIAKKYGISTDTELPNNYKDIEKTSTMSREQILNFTLPPIVALRNFMKMYAGGRQVVEMFKVITPDSMDGLNRVEAMQAYMDRKEKFSNPKDGVIDRAPVALYGRNMSESIIEQVLDEESPYGLEKGYYEMIEKTLGVASILFPMTMSPQFIAFKNTLKDLVGTNSFSSDQHRDINAGIMFTILTREDSPLRTYFNKPYSDQNYRTGKNSATLLYQMSKMLKKYPKLAGNEFFTKVTEDPDNKNSKSFKSIQFDGQQQYSPIEKDRIINDLTDLMYRPEKFVGRLPKGSSKEKIEERTKSIQEVKELGMKLAMHTFIANGFRQSAFNFADLLPPRFLKQPMDRTLAGLEPISISDYINEQSLKLANTRYFDGEDMLRFLRMFGEIRPGGANLVQRENFDNDKKVDPEISVNLQKYALVPSVLVGRSNVDSQIYMLSSTSKDGKTGTYVSIRKLTNEKKHVVGGDFLSIQTLGNKESVDTVLEKLSIMLDNTMHEDKNGDITQICML